MPPKIKNKNIYTYIKSRGSRSDRRDRDRLLGFGFVVEMDTIAIAMMLEGGVRVPVDEICRAWSTLPWDS